MLSYKGMHEAKVKDTTWQLYTSNEDAWASMLSDCAKAKESIDLEQFIFYKDDFGEELIDVCKKRAKEGVKVRFLWDAIGSFTFDGASIKKELSESGIELVFWQTLIPSFFKLPNYESWFWRNHRRTMVIDQRIAYTGSMCVHNRLKDWRDTNVRLEGKVVEEMLHAFNRMWARAVGHRVPPRPKRTERLARRKSIREKEFNYVTNYPSPGRRFVYTSLVEAIREAKSYIYITTPYFVPTHRLIRVIKLASERGVDVRIVLPEDSNAYIVDLGARSYFETLLRSGVKIFLYSGNMIHSKSIVIDDDYASVGSLNLDRVSLLYNFEANIITHNNDFTKELKEHFLKDLKESNEVNAIEWHSRALFKKIPEILVRIIRKFL